MSVREDFLKAQANIEKMTNGGLTFIGDSATAKYAQDEALGFLYNALEYIDPVVHKPLVNFFWYRDLPYVIGGGALEFSSFFKSNYSFDEQTPIASGSNNVLITVGSQYEKITTRVMPFSLILKVGYIDLMKADKMALNIFGDLEEGVQKRYNTLLDNISFFGLPGFNDSKGLFNLVPGYKKVEATTAWASQTGVEFFNNLNDIILEVVKNVEYDESKIPNRVLVPTALFTKLAAPLQIASGAVTATTGISLIEYLKKNLASNYAGFGGTIDILPNPYLAAIGDNSTGRIVIYRFDEDVVRGVMGMELTRGATLFDPNSQAYKTSFVTFIGEPQVIYPSAIAFYDNKA